MEYLKTKIIFLLFFAFMYTHDACAQIKAEPRNGDGIGTFLQRYGCNTASQRKEFIRLNKNKFTKDGGLILGRTYILPSAAKAKDNRSSSKKKSSGKKKNNIIEPLFGPDYQNVKVTSDVLKGCSFYLVSGHGGPDPGAIGYANGHELHEDEYAYDITLRLGRSLMQKGADVEFIIQDAKDGIRNEKYLSNSDRETCMGKTIPLNQLERLKQRCEQVNILSRKSRSKYKRAIVIHVDSRGTGDQVDVFCYHCPGSSMGRRLVDNINNTLANKYHIHQPARGFDGSISPRELYVLKNTNVPAAFLELGNIQNSKDQKRLIISSNRQALAEWIAQGIVKDAKK